MNFYLFLFILHRMGNFSSEVLFSFLLAGLLRRGTFPSPEKYPKGRWGDPRPPFFIQSDTYKGDTRLPLNFCRACGHLVTGAVGYALRLTALGLKVASCFADGSRSVSRRRRKHDIETKIRLPLQKAVRRSPTRSPPQIGCPEDLTASVAVQHQVRKRPIGKTGVRGVPGGVLVTFSPRKK